MSDVNPYQAPRADVADVESRTEWGEFQDGGRSVEVGQGFAWLASGFELFRRRPWTWIGITIIFGVISFQFARVPIVGMLISLLLPLFIAGMLIGCRDLERDGNFGVKYLFAAFPVSGPYAGRLILLSVFNVLAWVVVAIPVYLIMGKSLASLAGGDPAAIMAAGSAVLIGLLVALGLSVPVYMAMWFAPCLVVFNEMGPARALGQSFRGCLKNVMPFLFYGVLLLILLVLAAIPFGLGLLVAVPVTVASVYTAYRDIFYAPA